MKHDILSMIETLEAKKRSIDELLNSLKETVQKIEALPPEVSELLLRPIKQTVQETTGQQPSRYEESRRAARSYTTMRSKQFSSICTYFIQNKNSPVTVRELMIAVKISRSALTNILYRTQRDAFVSQKVPGERRLRKWTLSPEAYQQFVEQKEPNEDLYN